MTLSPSLRVFLGALCISTAPVFVKLVDLAPTPIGFYRCALGALALFALGRGPWKLPSGALARALLWTGVLFAADLYVWHRAVVYAGAGIGTILGNTQVFYVSILGFFLFKERLGARFWIGALLAFAGVVLLVDPGAGAVGPRYWEGIVFGLLTGVVYAVYLLGLRRCEAAKELDSFRLLGAISLVCSAVLLGVSMGEGTMRAPSPREWVWLGALALAAQVAGWRLIMSGLPALPVGRSGLILLCQPAFAALWGTVFFSEPMDAARLSGAGLTFAGIYAGAARNSPRRFGGSARTE